MAKRKVRTLGVTSQGYPAWIATDSKNSKFRKNFDSNENQIKSPNEIVVECISTLADIIKYHPEVAIQIQDRLKF